LVDRVVEEVLEDTTQEVTEEEPCECEHLRVKDNGLTLCWHGKWVPRKSILR